MIAHPADRRRVALVTAARERGGAEVVIELLATRLPAHGITPVLAAPEHSPNIERWRAAGLEICPLPIPSRLGELRQGARAVAEIGRRLAEAGVTIVHTHGIAAQLYAGLAARRRRLSTVYHVHDLFNPQCSADGALHRAALRVPAARTIAISASVAASLGARVPASRLHIVLDGVTSDIVEPSPDAAGAGPLVIWCGRLQQWKGPGHFIEMARQVRRAMPTARFAIVGGSLFGLEPQLAGTLRELAADLGSALTFVGHVEDARPWIRAAAVLVHSSERPEPFGLVMAEAMMQERPVAAFRHGGAAEIVLDGETGRLVTPADTSALARAVIELLGDSDGAVRMGQAGRRRALQYFDADGMAASVAAVYDLMPEHR